MIKCLFCACIQSSFFPLITQPQDVQRDQRVQKCGSCHILWYQTEGHRELLWWFMNPLKQEAARVTSTASSLTLKWNSEAAVVELASGGIYIRPLIFHVQ